MPDRVDVLVVGGGPAGLVAAWEAALAGREVLLLERDRAIGAPVRCAEGVGSKGLRLFMNPDGADWVACRISKVVIRAPDDTDVLVGSDDIGYILDRTRFEPALADQARRAGADLRIAAEAAGMRRDNGRWTVRVESARGDFDVSAAVVIGADGVESMVGRWAGIDTRVPSREMESGAQYVLQGPAFDPEAIIIHWADRVAPAGYAWVFPRSATAANVGLGMIALKGDGRPARAWLDDYVARYFPGAAITGMTVGGIIGKATLKRSWTDGVVLAGDAAHMVTPLTGAGINNAMIAGRLAGRHAAAAVAAGDTSAARLSRYHADWMEAEGDQNERWYRIKKALAGLDDEFFNGLARTVNAIPREKRSFARIFAHALVRNPALIPVAARFFV